MSSNLQKTIEQYYLSTSDNVVSVGYGYKTKNNTKTTTKSVVFGVAKKKPPHELSQDELLPSTITLDDGTIIPTDVVEQKASFSALSNCFEKLDSSSDDHRIEHRPVVGGISLSLNALDAGTGTLGGIVKDYNNGCCSILTNAHVIAKDQFINSDKDVGGSHWNATSNRIIQQGVADGGDIDTDWVGLIKRYYPINATGINYIDAAIGSADPKKIELSSVSILGLNNTNALPFATSSEIDSLIGRRLFKSGRSTGYIGEDPCPIVALLINTSATIGNYNLQGTLTAVDFSDVILFVYEETGPSGFPKPNVCVPGDSGSLLLADFDGVKKIVGLVFAGGSFEGPGSDTFNAGLACRIDRVSQLLQIGEWNGIAVKFDNIDEWNTKTVNGLSNTVNFTETNKVYWQIGSSGDNSVYLSTSTPILSLTTNIDPCDGIVSCTYPTPPQPPTPPDPPPPRAGNNTANYNLVADWNGNDGNVTTVGTNGRSSSYGTYDQNGNVWEIVSATEMGESAPVFVSLGGSWNSPPNEIEKCSKYLITANTRQSIVGVRLMKPTDILQSSTATLYGNSACYSGIDDGGLSIFNRSDNFTLIETKRYRSNSYLSPTSCIPIDINTGPIFSRGNGRGVVVIGNVLYTTVVQSNKIRMNDINTGADLGFIQTQNESMSCIAYDGTYFYTTDYAGKPLVYVIDPNTGNNVRTIKMKIPDSGGWNMDGLEYFDGKLIMNRCDLSTIYDIYDLDGNVLVKEFINVTKELILYCAPNDIGLFRSTGITYDGRNFIISLLGYSSIGNSGSAVPCIGANEPNKTFTQRFGVFDGNTGKIIGIINPNFIDFCGAAQEGYYGIEDLSIDYATRPDITETFTPWVFVGDSGNVADTAGCDSNNYGAVDYNYLIQKFPLTNNEYCSFLNSVAKNDPYDLWVSIMDSSIVGGISRSGSSGNYTYTVKTNMGNKPVNCITWLNAARLCNWLHNRLSNENSTETETGAYTLEGYMGADIVAPNPDAKYRIPTIDEWHKAAYYKGGSTTAGYWSYAIASDTAPCAVLATSTGDGSVCPE